MKTPFFPCVSLALSASLCLAASARAAPEGVEIVSVRATAHFDFDRASLRPADRAAMLAEVARMKDVTWQTVQTTGHTDSVGRADYNEQLSSRRAEAVKAHLVGQGLDASMIRTLGRSEAAPVADNRSGEGRAKNRRAEIEFRGVRTAAAGPR